MGTKIEQKIKKIIDSKGWTIYRLSKASGVPMTVLYSLGKKKNGPTAETLVKLANALDVSIDELVR